MRTKNLKSTKLNIGSGNEYRKGWINLDIEPKWKPDMVCDVSKRIPLKESTIEKVFIKHVLEHIEPSKFGKVMSEIYRVCKNGALIKIYVPYFSCSITYKTIDHVSFFTYFTFANEERFKIEKRRLHFFRKSFGYESRFITAITRILNPVLSFIPNLVPLFYERFFCWIFPMEELEVTLGVKK